MKQLFLFFLLIAMGNIHAGINLPYLNIYGYELREAKKIDHNHYDLEYVFFNGGTNINIFVSNDKGRWMVDSILGVDYCPNCLPNKRLKKCRYSLNQSYEEIKAYVESDDFIYHLFDDESSESATKCKYYYVE